MAKFEKKLIQTEERAVKPIPVGSHFIVPVERTVKVQPPGMWGILLWRRPAAVVIQHPDGSDEVVSIQDPTRKAQLFLLGLGLLGAFSVWLINKCQMKDREG